MDNSRNSDSRCESESIVPNIDQIMIFQMNTYACESYVHSVFARLFFICLIY